MVLTREDYNELLKTDAPLAYICNAYITSLEQRIKELEEPKTCLGCKYHESEDLYIGYCTKLDTDVNNKWGCLSYEPKWE